MAASLYEQWVLSDWSGAGPTAFVHRLAGGPIVVAAGESDALANLRLQRPLESTTLRQSHL